MWNHRVWFHCNYGLLLDVFVGRAFNDSEVYLVIKNNNDVNMFIETHFPPKYDCWFSILFLEWFYLNKEVVLPVNVTHYLQQELHVCNEAQTSLEWAYDYLWMADSTRIMAWTGITSLLSSSNSDSLYNQVYVNWMITLQANGFIIPCHIDTSFILLQSFSS